MQSRRLDMKQRLAGIIGRDGVISVLVTHRRTGPHVLRVDLERERLEPVREYRKLLIWCWRRPALALIVGLLVLGVLLSFLMNWAALVSRLGGLVMIVALIGFVSRSTRPVMPGGAGMGADFADMSFADYARRVELGLTLVGALVWAFGDWGCSFIHCGGATCLP